MKNKNLKLIISLSILMSTYSIQSWAQNNVLRFDLENYHSDSLYITGISDNNQNRVIIKGIKNNPTNWTFIIPDSINRVLSNFEVIPFLFDKENKTASSTDFTYIDDGDTLRTFLFNYHANNPIIKAKFIKRESVEQPFRVVLDGEIIEIKGTIVKDCFQLTSVNKDSDLFVRLKYPNFSFFYDLESLGYDKTLSLYESISNQYPQSRFLVSNLYRYYPNYKSKNDLKRVFSHFNDSAINNYGGLRLKEYIVSTRFKNSLFTNYNNNSKEYLVQDTSQYNLIIFSASWCKPCIEEIPELIRIYDNLQHNIIFTYVTIDDKSTYKEWGELMKKYGIAWRSLTTNGDIEQIRSLYFVEGIPANLLVFPNGDYEPIDIRDNNQRKKLYFLCKKPFDLSSQNTDN